jgi:hypothetical protein
MPDAKRWEPGKVHRYVGKEERNAGCCKAAVCVCFQHERGMYQMTVEGRYSEEDSEYFSDEDPTVKVGGKSKRDLWA